MACHKCGGVLYHLYHSFKNTAPVIEKTSPMIEMVKELDVSSKIYQSTTNHPQQKTIETKTTRVYNAIQHSILMQQKYDMHRYKHQRYINHQKNIKENKQQKEISESIEEVKQINYAGNVKPREIRNVVYIEEQKGEIRGYEEGKDYNPKRGYNPWVKKEKKKRKDKGIARIIKRLEEEPKVDREERIKQKKGKAKKRKKEKKLEIATKKFRKDETNTWKARRLIDISLTQFIDVLIQNKIDFHTVDDVKEVLTEKLFM